ncbi:hypothetical protein [Lysobacter sp. HA18]
MKLTHLVAIPCGLFVCVLLLGIFENLTRHFFPAAIKFDPQSALGWMRYLNSVPGGARCYFALQRGAASAGGPTTTLVLSRRSPQVAALVISLPLTAFAVETLLALGYPRRRLGTVARDCDRR